MKSNRKLTDKEIEFIWDSVEDIPFRECRELDGELIIDSDFFIWKIGVTRDEIWR